MIKYCKIEKNAGANIVQSESAPDMKQEGEKRGTYHPMAAW